jgi:acyl-CoA thioesterase-2
MDEQYERDNRDRDDEESRAVRRLLRSRPVDLRPVERPVSLRTAPEEGLQAVWMRASGPMPPQTLPHTALLAFASDYTLLGSALRRHNLSWNAEGMKTASLDHAMWFHRPARMDDWVLYVQGSPSASGARGLGLGWMFGRDGTLVASTAQEGMIRVPPSTP